MLVDMDLQFQQYIPGPPVTKDQLWDMCTRSDKVTVSSWAGRWHRQTVSNKSQYDFNALSSMNLLGKEAYKPVIVAGSGPSLKKNFRELKTRMERDQFQEDRETQGRGDIRIVSCLHNFPFFEDNDVMKATDYYITLDAGEITIREMFEGGKNKEEWYWARTKHRTLIAHHTTQPELLKKWQGPVFFYTDQSQSPEALKQYGIDPKVCIPYSVGGCVAGAATYFAEAILGAGSLIFIGMDFAFDYMKKFHAWDSQYDSMFSGTIPATDVFGNRVYTWPSYWNFKAWFEYQALGGRGNHPHNWINCTEGGILGAWPEGNIKQITQMDLKNCLRMFNRHRDMQHWAEKMVLLW